MHTYTLYNQWKKMAALTVFAVAAVLQLTGCNGLNIPGVPVTIPIAQSIEVTAAGAATGSADIAVGALCDLFTEEQLNMLVRNAAGDEIADRVTVTAVELEAVDIVATSGSFSPFTDANLSLSILEAGANPIDLGSASNSGGLGESFSLTRETTLNLLTALEDGQCGVPTLSLSGAGVGGAGDITFSVSVRVLVFTTVQLF